MVMLAITLMVSSMRGIHGRSHLSLFRIAESLASSISEVSGIAMAEREATTTYVRQHAIDQGAYLSALPSTFLQPLRLFRYYP